MANKGMFDDYGNEYKQLQVISRKSEDELQKIISTFPGPIKVFHIYGLNGRHYAWFESPIKIEEIKIKGV